MELENTNIDLKDNTVLLDQQIKDNDIKYTLSNVEYNINDLKKFIDNEKLTTNTVIENLENFTEYFSNIIKKYNLEIDNLKHRVNYLESTTNMDNVNQVVSYLEPNTNMSNQDLDLSNKQKPDEFVIYNANKREYNRSCAGCLF